MAHVKLYESERPARLVLDAKVLDVDRGIGECPQQRGELAGGIADDDPHRGELAGPHAVLDRNPGAARGTGREQGLQRLT